MIEEHVDDVVERHAVSGTAADCRVRPAAVPAQRAVGPVEEKPAPMPRVQQASPDHLGQRTLTRGGRELD